MHLISERNGSYIKPVFAVDLVSAINQIVRFKYRKVIPFTMQMSLFLSRAIQLLLYTSTIHASPVENHSHPYSCKSIQAPHIPGASILSISGQEKRNFTVPPNPQLLFPGVSNLNICKVLLRLQHHNAKNEVLVQVWLPLENWNGRFVGVGGSGWAAGLGDVGLAPFAIQGYAAASTDAGLPGDPYSPGEHILDSAGQVNFQLLENFASRSVHDLAVAGKAITSSYYGTRPNFAYWNGCSTGGRQGMASAQKYPNDFDGILAGAPAIYWTAYVVAELWPQVVMKEDNIFPTQCELDAFTAAAVKTCDNLDGVEDKVITNLAKCDFDLFSVVGSEFQCEDESKVRLTRSVASIVQKIWSGPKLPSGAALWDGLTVAAPLSFLANTALETGKRVGKPFFISDTWIRYFVEADPKYYVSKIDKTVWKVDGHFGP